MPAPRRRPPRTGRRMPPVDAPRWIAAIGSRPGPRRSVAGIGGAFIAGIVVLAVLDGTRSYQATVDSTSQELEALSRVIAEQTARSLQATDVVLRHLVDEYRTGTLPALTRDALHAHLQQQAVGLVQIDGLAVFDADGSARAVSLMPPARQPPVNVA